MNLTKQTRQVLALMARETRTLAHMTGKVRHRLASPDTFQIVIQK